MSKIHPLVMATIENERARRELELERLRSAREACHTVSVGGQNRAIALGKKIRQLEEITGSWRLVLATVLGSMDDADPYDTGVSPELRASSAAMVERTSGHPDPASTEEGFRKRMGLATEKPRVIGSKNPRLDKLRCVPCTERHRATWRTSGAALVDITSADLPDGGVCVMCGADVLA